MKSNKEEVLRTFKEFWYTWAERKNQSNTIDDIKIFFDKEITSIGSGEHERGRDYDEVFKNFNDDFNELHTPIALTFNWITTKMLSETTAFVEAESKLEIEVEEGALLSFLIRITSIFNEKIDGWKIIHNHVSMPSDGQNIGESYPIDKLKARNAKLEKLVRERTQEVEDQKTELRRQKEKTENLLYNILPKSVAKELFQKGKVQPKKFNEVSILFTDFVGFTKIAKELSPDKLVVELNELFEYFDEVILKQELEKIKTIGDSYMAVCGLPEPNNEHAQKCIIAAKEMMAYLEKRNRNSIIKWHMRIGIHSGPIVAGVVGNHKFSYDLWGDSVNIASRLESSSQAGMINISKQSYDLVKESIQCQSRGKILVKGGMEIEMYFVR